MQTAPTIEMAMSHVRRTTSETILFARSTLVAPIVYASVTTPMAMVTKRPPHANAITSCQNGAPRVASTPTDAAEVLDSC